MLISVLYPTCERSHTVLGFWGLTPFRVTGLEVHTMGLHSAVRKDRMLPSATTRMDLERKHFLNELPDLKIKCMMECISSRSAGHVHVPKRVVQAVPFPTVTGTSGLPISNRGTLAPSTPQAVGPLPRSLQRAPPGRAASFPGECTSSPRSLAVLFWSSEPKCFSEHDFYRAHR